MGGDAEMIWEVWGSGRDEGKNERCKNAQILHLRSLSGVSFGCVPLLETCSCRPTRSEYGLSSFLNQGREKMEGR